MPELPEVETTCRGVRPHLIDATVTDWIVRQPKLRYPVAPEWGKAIGQPFIDVARRAKYILMTFANGVGIVHLGMSGSLRILEAARPWRKHDHLALQLSTGLQMRYHDPRRFGAWLWTDGDPQHHPLLRNLGPEPLGGDFDAVYLRTACGKRRGSIKQALMDSKVVVGVGNIYASEALFLAGIRPTRSAGRISAGRLANLVEAIQTVLARSILQGGTTLRDFLHQDGSAGYFRQQLRVYERDGQPCITCGSTIRRIVIGQRSTFYCPRCQT